VIRIISLTAILILGTACGQSEDASTAAQSPPAAAATQADAAAASRAAETPAAETPRPETGNAAAASDEPAAGDSASARVELAQVDLSSVEAAGFVEGRHYRRLSPTQSTSTSPEQVEVAEFFMYSCIHCYNLEPFVEAWLPDKPDYINFVRIPTTWNPTVRLHAQAFYAAQALGKGEEMHWPFFREMHESSNFLQTPDALASFFGRFDVSNDDFESVFDSFGVINQVNRAEELGRRYRVDSTPTIVINGKYTTGTAMADPINGNPERLFDLIEALSAAEMGR
jgi:thiol:disulfide interchange protein DsbA